MNMLCVRASAFIAVAVSASSAMGVGLPPNAKVHGVTQAQLSVRWWQWVANTRANQDPTSDLTGAAAAGGDQGDVFFLSGAGTGDPVHRTVTVPEGRVLFFPLVNASADNTAPFGEAPTNLTVAQLYAIYGPALGGTTNLHCTVDGHSVNHLERHRQRAVFSYTVTHADNYIARTGYDPTFGTGVYPSTVSPVTTDGYWVALQPLSPGVHTLSFGAYVPDFDFTQDISYTITVVHRPHNDGETVDPDRKIEGLTQAQWSVAWWQWAIDTTTAQDPIADPTGAQGFRGDVGHHVFFLAGSYSTDPVERTVNVPEGDTIFLPLINSFTDNTSPFGQPPSTYTGQQLLDFLSASNDLTDDLYCMVDGFPTPNLGDYRQKAIGAYTVHQADNFDVRFGFDPTRGTGHYPATVSPAAFDGYWVALKPLSRGTHVIEFGGEIPGVFSQEITYTVNVVHH